MVQYPYCIYLDIGIYNILPDINIVIQQVDQYYLDLIDFFEGVFGEVLLKIDYVFDLNIELHCAKERDYG